MRELRIFDSTPSRQRRLIKLIIATVLGAFVLLAAMARPRPQVTSVSAVSSTELGSYNHRAYREVKLQLRGTAPGGAYDVPVTLAYPTHGRDYSGVAVVDVVNTIFVTWPDPLPAPAYARSLLSARLHLGDEYLFGSGHVYLSVNWDKDALEAPAPAIADPGDAFTIIRDVAGLARDPSRIPSQASAERLGHGDRLRLLTVRRLLRDFYRTHANSTGGLAFDGALYGGAGGLSRPGLGFHLCAMARSLTAAR